jgi:hypothetical protein
MAESQPPAWQPSDITHTTFVDQAGDCVLSISYSVILLNMPVLTWPSMHEGSWRAATQDEVQKVCMAGDSEDTEGAGALAF